MTTGAPALTPPRSKAHRITPHHHSKAHYADQNRQRDMNQNNDSKKSNKRQPPASTSKKSQHERASKRQNSNPTPCKSKSTNVNDIPDELLDVNDPQIAHRVRQRQKMISKGKNTAGYARYRTMVPLKDRKAKSLTTPSTPNPYLQVSTKRWQGLVRAWRIALHQYDPPELVQTLQPPPMLSPDDDEEGKAKSKSILEDGKKEGKDLDAVFSECQTPSQDKSSKMNISPASQMSISPAESISIRDDSHDGDGVSPCVSVFSPSTPAKSKSKSGGKSEARRELDTLFAKAKTTTTAEKKKKEPATKINSVSKSNGEEEQQEQPRKLRTGATGWGDDSSDEEDDELL